MARIRLKVEDMHNRLAYSAALSNLAMAIGEQLKRASPLLYFPQTALKSTKTEVRLLFHHDAYHQTQDELAELLGLLVYLNGTDSFWVSIFYHWNDSWSASIPLIYGLGYS